MPEPPDPTPPVPGPDAGLPGPPDPAPKPGELPETGLPGAPAPDPEAPPPDDPAPPDPAPEPPPADTPMLDPASESAAPGEDTASHAAAALPEAPVRAESPPGEVSAAPAEPPPPLLAAAPPPGPGAGAEDVPPPDPALFEHALRIAEALVFAADRPITPARLQDALPEGCEARAVLTALTARCAGRPVELVEVAGGFAFRTAPDLAPSITRVVEVPRRLPRAAMETLAIIAYHQPVTRAEVEEIRGASLSQTTLESLLEMGLIAPRGRKEVPGRPSLWGTTPRFLEQFGLKSLADLPRREELVNEPPTLPLDAPPTPPPGT